MKRFVPGLLALLLLAGCSSSKSAEPPAPSTLTVASQAPPATQPAPAPTPPAPDEPAPVKGPLYLPTLPANPLWAGPVSVIVENSPQSRPQSGLEKADLVFEALAESEITRFLAFYWSQPAAKIGPIRSARIYWVQIAGRYDLPFAHAGGNTDALAILQTQWGAKDLDEIYGAGGFFRRTADRQPPHNLYGSTQLLDAAIRARKIEMKPVPTSDRQSAAFAPGTAAAKVELLWHKRHTLHWELADGQYRRIVDGEPHRLEGGAVIAAPNLIFLHVTGVDHGPDDGWVLDLPKGGKATVLVAGHQWEGTWSLGDGGFAITPAAATKPVLLAPGQVWIHLITQDSRYSVQAK